MIDGVGVADGCGDGHAEQVAQPADVAACGVCLVEDAVFVQRLAAAGDVECQPQPSVPHWVGRDGAADVDEQVRVGRVRPSGGSVVELGAQCLVDRLGEQDGSVAEMESPVSQVGELQRSDLSAAKAVEGDEGGERSPGGIRRVEGFADDAWIERQRAGHRAGHRVRIRLVGLAKTSLAGFEHGEDRPEASDGQRPSGPGGGRTAVISLRDFSQRAVSVVGPQTQGGLRRPEVDTDADLAAGAASRRDGAAMCHYVEPDLQLGDHRRWQVCRDPLEPSLDGRGAVVDEHPCFLEDGADGPLGKPALVEHGRLGAGDRRSRGVLKAEQDSQTGSDVVRVVVVPSVSSGVARAKASRPAASSGIGGWRTTPKAGLRSWAITNNTSWRCDTGGGIGASTSGFERLRPWRRQCLVHVGEEQLLTVSIRADQVDAVAGTARLRLAVRKHKRQTPCGSTARTVSQMAHTPSRYLMFHPRQAQHTQVWYRVAPHAWQYWHESTVRGPAGWHRPHRPPRSDQ